MNRKILRIAGATNNLKCYFEACNERRSYQCLHLNPHCPSPIIDRIIIGKRSMLIGWSSSIFAYLAYSICIFPNSTDSIKASTSSETGVGNLPSAIRIYSGDFYSAVASHSEFHNLWFLNEKSIAFQKSQSIVFRKSQTSSISHANSSLGQLILVKEMSRKKNPVWHSCISIVRL